MDNHDIEIETDPHPDYLKAFNDGYLLAKFRPELAAELSNALDGKSERAMGFKEGLLQYEADMDKSMHPDWMKDHEAEKDMGRGVDMDRDIEPGEPDLERD